MKMIAVAAALEENIVTKKWSIYCQGYYKLGRRDFRCHKLSGHGVVNMVQAVEMSCNVYFYNLSLKMGIDIWAKYAKRFGFEKVTGIDLPEVEEKTGIIPTTNYFNLVYREGEWTQGHFLNSYIGQGDVLATPIQMAVYTMALANNGTYYTPHFIHKVEDGNTKDITEIKVPPKHIEGISEETFAFIRKAMYRVTNNYSGTGKAAWVPGIKTAGKTGTAENPHGRPHSWFVGYSPYKDPEIAVVVVVENAGDGGAIAAPIAGWIMEKYHYGRIIRYKLIEKAQQADTTQSDSTIAPSRATLDSLATYSYN